MAINPKIKQKAEDIRKKIFGSEVRESLASGIEAISEDVEATIGRQGYVEEQFQNVIDETTDKDVISAPELIAARNGEANLKTRLDKEHQEVTTQLQQTEQELNAQLAQRPTQEEVNYLLGNISDGTPLFSDSVAGMSDTSRLYVNTSDGLLYSHDGTSFVTTGVVYQSTGIQRGSVTPEKTSFIEVSPNLFDKTKAIQGKQYGTATAAAKNINDFADAGNNYVWVCPAFTAKPNTSYTLNSKLSGSGATVASFKSDGTYDRGLAGVANGDGTYTITTNANTGYIGFNMNSLEVDINTLMMVEGTTLPTEYTPFYKKLDERLIENTVERLEVVESIFTDGTITEIVQSTEIKGNQIDFVTKIDSGNLLDKTKITKGYVLDGANGGVPKAAAGFAITDYIEFDAGTDYYFGNVYIGYYAFYDSDKEFISGKGIYTVGDIDGLTNPITRPAGTKYGRFTVLEANYDRAWVYTKNEKPNDFPSYALGSNVNVNSASQSITSPTDYKGNEIILFNKGLSIGDSLTQGTMNINTPTPGYVNKPEYSYPTYLTKLTNIPMTNMGDGGITLKRWYERNSTKDWTGHDFAILQVGVNDVLQGVNHSEVTQYLQTIIDKLKTDNNGIKIFVATTIPAISYSGDGYDSMSQTIRDFVSSLNDSDVYLVDLALYGKTKDFDAYNNGHLSALGYLKLAEDYKAYISYIINENKIEFRNVQFTSTEDKY